jgi:serine/threonine-protein kinase
MALSTGTRFGHYEITEQIGAGGMGEVYRARDTTLEREVAIKVLPESFLSDPARVARFEQEAKTLASLNHPNIAQVHGLERAEGNTAIVMELVEGPTLADRIALGAINADEALGIAMQIANALEAAHGKGIVHRDLKPANVKLRPDGTVKVLDFGIAKPVAPELDSGGSSPIMTTPVTQVGVILGTAAYMSPEQARGKPVDQRADIWAFGCVLYEMLTGQLAFGGEDVAVTLARVIANETELGSLAGLASPQVRHTIALCLEKDPAKRIADIRDVRLMLQGRFELPISAARSGDADPRPSALPLAAAMLIVGAIGAGLIGWNLKPEPVTEPPRVVRGIHVLPEGLTFRNVVLPTLSIAPDGNRFAYQASDALYLRRFDDLEATAIPGTAALSITPEFSPDGSSLIVVYGRQLRRVAVAGGPSPPLTTVDSGVNGIDWSRDGTILLALDDSISEVSENGGEPRRLIDNPAGYTLAPQRLPRGDWILYTWMDNLGRADARTQSSEIRVESPSSGERHVIRAGGTSARYLSTGHLVYAYEGVLYAVPFDIETLEATGSAVPVIEGVAMSVAGVAHFDVSDRGDLIYIPGNASVAGADYTLVTADRSGTVRPVGDLSGPYGHVRASHDGRTVAVDSVDDAESAIYVYDLDGSSAPRRLTRTGSRNTDPVWTADDSRIAFRSDRGGDQGIWIQSIAGTAAAERLTTAADGETHIPEDISPDGHTLLFAIESGAGSYTLWSVAVAGGAPERIGDIESIEPLGAGFSPDGSWIAYHQLQSAGAELSANSGVFIVSYPTPGEPIQLPKIERDFMPVWSRDGLQVNYVPSTSSGQLVSVDVSTENGLSFTPGPAIPFALTGGRLSGATRSFDVLPDGRFIGFVSGSDFGSLAPQQSEVRYVLNWFEELERLVPTGSD